MVILLFYRAALYRKSAKISSQIFTAFGILISGYSLGILSLTMQRFFTIQFSIVASYFYVQAWFFLGIGLFGFCFILEKLYRNSLETRYIFSLLAITSIFINAFESGNLILDSIGYVLFFLLNFYVIIFLVFLLKRSTEITRKLLELILIGYLIYIFGFLSAKDAVLYLINSEIFLLVTYPLMFIGAIITFYGFLKIPLFIDADWRENIEEINIINRNSNEFLFSYNFHTPDYGFSFENKLFSSGIVGLQTIIGSISSDQQEVNEVELEESTLLLKIINSVIIVLTVRNNFRIYSQILEQIAKQFNDSYGYIVNSGLIDSSSQSLFSGFEKNIHKILYS
jgi:hypothetical protein